MTNLTIQSIEDAYSHEAHGFCPGWRGFGYLGERNSAIAAIEDGEWNDKWTDVATADAAIVAQANAQGWDEETLFWWLNSKNGRWYGDNVLFGSSDPAKAAINLMKDEA